MKGKQMYLKSVAFCVIIFYRNGRRLYFSSHVSGYDMKASSEILALGYPNTSMYLGMCIRGSLLRNLLYKYWQKATLSLGYVIQGILKRVSSSSLYKIMEEGYPITSMYPDETKRLHLDGMYSGLKWSLLRNYYIKLARYILRYGVAFV